MKKLVQIDLYSLPVYQEWQNAGGGSPAPQAIKSVHFEYDYSLCQGLTASGANNGGSIDAYESAARHLKVAVEALEPLEKQGKLRPSDTSNMGHWRGAIQALEEALTKLRAMR